MKFTFVLATLFLAFAITACTKQSTEISDDSIQHAMSSPEHSDIIKINVDSHFFSGLPTKIPAIITITKGAVQGFRFSLQDVKDALESMTAGELIQDDENRRQELQTGLEKMLASEHMTMETLLGPYEHVILLLSADPSFGECPPCDEAFSTLNPGDTIAGFTIKNVLLENR